MLKDLFLKETENAVELAVKNNSLGQMTEYTKGTLTVEKPKNVEFGDFAINVSSLARNAKIAPPQIANAICENLTINNYDVTVVGGFINFKVSKELLCDAVEEIFKKGENYGKPENVKTEKINLEYVSANPTGP
ncbi:arginine--tRNA ligase, partial [bacterium]|nr:arginine--tRNA ligase [bacterium]